MASYINHCCIMGGALADDIHFLFSLHRRLSSHRKAKHDKRCAILPKEDTSLKTSKLKGICSKMARRSLEIVDPKAVGKLALALNHRSVLEQMPITTTGLTGN